MDTANMAAAETDVSHSGTETTCHQMAVSYKVGWRPIKNSTPFLQTQKKRWKCVLKLKKAEWDVIISMFQRQIKRWAFVMKQSKILNK